MKKSKIIASIFLVAALLISFIAGKEFLKMHKEEPIVKGPGVTEIKMLSEYSPELKGTNADTKIYVLKGKKPGGSSLILGGTHGNEPSGFLSAVVLIENLVPKEGTVYIMPRANNSSFTHNDPQEGSPQQFTIDTPNGERWFRYGSRATNPIDQWPDPDVYVHAASKQQLSGSETRNLNRGYPGREDGTLTEQVCYGITELIKTKDINMTFDLHEASPEYPVINAIVAHEDAMALAAPVSINMQMNGINIGLEPSPKKLRGLSHRELGDFTDTYSILMETSNPAQGRLRGKTNEELVLKGQDERYEKAGQLGYLFVPFDSKGHPIEERVGRHIEGINEFFKAYTEQHPDKPIVVENIPKYENIIKDGIGEYLLPVK